MLCEKCGKYKATTHIRTVVNGVAYEKNLCSHCAAAEGFSVSAQNPLGNMLASMFGDALEAKPFNANVCPVCGTAFSQIAKSGKVGCAECYKTFRSELLPYLKRVHGSVKHMGKAPYYVPIKSNTIEALKAELKHLIAEENYEQAAVVRDKIKSLEDGGNE